MPAADFPIVSRLRAAGCVFAEDEARMLTSTARTPAELDAMVDRRVAGLPLEQVLGWAEFCGRRIIVAPGVFVPRRRTEFLVRRAEALLRGDHAAGAPREGVVRPGDVIVDLCCGVGAIGAALAAVVDRAEVHAADIDPVAVRCARLNLPGPRGHVYQGDLYEPLPAALRGQVGILLANVPYVPAGEVALLPPEARDYEARVALDGGPDGLGVLRRVTAGAPAWLAPGGHLLSEISERQVAAATAAATGAGLAARVDRSGEHGATVLIATRPAPADASRMGQGRPGPDQGDPGPHAGGPLLRG